MNVLLAGIIKDQMDGKGDTFATLSPAPAAAPVSHAGNGGGATETVASPPRLTE